MRGPFDDLCKPRGVRCQSAVSAVRDVRTMTMFLRTVWKKAGYVSEMSMDLRASIMGP